LPAIQEGQPGPQMTEEPHKSVPDRVGWLEKRGKVRKSWTKRYFVLQNNELKYFKSDRPTERSQGRILLDGCSVEIAPESKYGRKFCFELNAPLQNRVFVIVADNGTSLQEWMNAIRRAMLRLRRERSKTEAQRRKRGSVPSTAESDSDTDNSKLNISTATPTKTDPLTTHDATSPSAPDPAAQKAHSLTNESSTLATSTSKTDSMMASSAPSSSKPVGAGNIIPNRKRSSVAATAPAKGDDKYGVYLQWLEETNGRKSIIQNTKREGDGPVLHRHLLDEEKEKSAGCDCSRCIII